MSQDTTRRGRSFVTAAVKGGELTSESGRYSIRQGIERGKFLLCESGERYEIIKVVAEVPRANLWGSTRRFALIACEIEDEIQRRSEAAP